ncbi:obg-like ATPase 1 [Diaphorina citri]|uniref:Obg-like ATPase 1 n=1 Tax=Diaphorina citri TaxID=121845 RepID=A0A1S3D2L6_DIACI|nr:obg-like ATPase 1 [Diaphorina citri]
MKNRPKSNLRGRVGAFEDDDVTHVEGEVNPVRDIEIIIMILVQRGDKKLKPEYDALVKIKAFVCEGDKRHARYGDWSNADIEHLNKLNLLTAKTQIYLVNLSAKDYIKKKNKWLPKIKEWVDANDPGATIIPFSGVFEHQLVDMPDDERQRYLDEQKATR